MNIKKYRIEHSPTYADLVVEIDFDFVKKIKNSTGEEDYPIMIAIKDMVEFWHDWYRKFDANDNDYLKTFLKQLCREVMRITTSNNLKAHGVIEEMKSLEGWCPMDGSFGIKILSVNEPDFSGEDDYEITEINK